MTNETQDARIILDPFLEHPKHGLLLAECQCPQSDFRTGQRPYRSFDSDTSNLPFSPNYMYLLPNILREVSTAAVGYSICRNTKIFSLRDAISVPTALVWDRDIICDN